MVQTGACCLARDADTAVSAGELIRAVEELRLGAGAEHTRRRELEGALRESAAIFKRELHDKNLELAALQQQLGSVPAHISPVSYVRSPHICFQSVQMYAVPTHAFSPYTGVQSTHMYAV